MQVDCEDFLSASLMQVVSSTYRNLHVNLHEIAPNLINDQTSINLSKPTFVM